MEFSSYAAIRTLAFSHPPFTRLKKKKKTTSRYRFKPAVTKSSALTGWESHPDIFPLAIRLVRHASCLRCCFSFPATDTVAQPERGGCVCTNAWWVGVILSFLFSPFLRRRETIGAIPARVEEKRGDTAGGRLLRCRYGGATRWSWD